MTTGTSTVILSFENKHYNPISIYWLDTFEADPLKAAKLQAELDPGESYLQGSFVGETWLIYDQVSNKLLRNLKAIKDIELNITGEVRRLPAKGSTLDIISASHRPTEPDRNFALDFDGENDVVIIPHETESDNLHLGDDSDAYEWTLESWVFRYIDQVEHPILEKSDGETGGFGLRVGENSKIQAGLINGTTFTYGEGTTEIKPRQWYHLAASFNGRTLFKYTDLFEPIWTNPSDRYLQNVAFYRPIAPQGYVRLGDYCDPGLVDPDGEMITGVHKLPRRVLVACLQKPGATNKVFLGDDGNPLFDETFNPWEQGFIKATSYTLIWQSEDPIAPVSIWAPAHTDSNYKAIGYVFKEGITPPDASVDAEGYYLVHEDLLIPSAFEEETDWANTPALGADLGTEEALTVKGALGTGFFAASTSSNALPAEVFAINTEVIEQSFHEFKTYVNGQPEKTTIKQGLDLKSNRTVLDLNGTTEFLELAPMMNQDLSAGFTAETWVNFRHDNPITKPTDPPRNAAGNESQFPIIHLQEMTAEAAIAIQKEKERVVAEEDRETKLAELKSAITTAKRPLNNVNDRTHIAVNGATTIQQEVEGISTAADTDVQTTATAAAADGAGEAEATAASKALTIAATWLSVKEASDRQKTELEAVLEKTIDAHTFAQKTAQFNETIAAISDANTVVITDFVDASIIVEQLTKRAVALIPAAVTASSIIFTNANDANDTAQAAVADADKPTPEQLQTAATNAAAALDSAQALENLVTATDAAANTVTASDGTITTVEALAEAAKIAAEATPGTFDAAAAVTEAHTAIVALKAAATITVVTEFPPHPEFEAVQDAIELAFQASEIAIELPSIKDKTNSIVNDLSGAGSPGLAYASAILVFENAEAAEETAKTNATTAEANKKGIQLSYNSTDNKLSFIVETGSASTPHEISDFLTIETRETHVASFALRAVEAVYNMTKEGALSFPALSPLEVTALDALEKAKIAEAAALRNPDEAVVLGIVTETRDAALVALKEASAIAKDTNGTNGLAELQTTNTLAQALTAAANNDDIEAVRVAALAAVEAVKLTTGDMTENINDIPEADKTRLIAAKVVVQATEALKAAANAFTRVNAAATDDSKTVAEEVDLIYSSAIELNTWLHIAVVLDATGKLTVYKNGEHFATPADIQVANHSSILRPIHWGDGRLGHQLGASQLFLNGQISEMRFWNRAQDETRIAAFYTREIGNLPGLVAYWPLNEGPKMDRILDLSGSGFHMQQLKEVKSLRATSELGHFEGVLNDKLNLTFGEQTNAEGVQIPARTKGHLSLDFWFRLDTDFTGDRLQVMRHGNNWALEIIKTGSGQQRIAFSYKDDGTDPWKMAVMDLDEAINFIGKGWTHVALVYNADPKDGEERFETIFIDGQFRKLENVAARIPAPVADETPAKFTIGAGNLPGTALYLSEVAFWSTLVPPYATSQNRFYQLRDTDLASDTLVAYWPFDSETNLAADLTWVPGTAATPETAFGTNDLKLIPADKPSHKWNNRSKLRLLPFSIIPQKTTAPIKIGALEPQNSLMRLGLLKNTHFEGMIDSVRIWEKARTDEEIKSVWNQKIQGDEPGLLRYYRFDTGKGEYAINHETRDAQPVDSSFNGKFGGENSIRNLRLWSTALSFAELEANMNLDDLGQLFPFDQTNRLITHTEEPVFDEENNPVMDGDEQATEIKSPGQDEVIIRAGNGEEQIHLDSNFTIEIEVKIDTFVLSGKEHYLLFKQDTWALMIFREERELYFGFTYDYAQNIQRNDWKRIDADRSPVTDRTWVYLAIVGDADSQEISLYQDRQDRSRTVLALQKSADLYDLKVNDFPMQLGEEGKPKWGVSDLLLMDGVHFDGVNDQIKLPRMADDYSRGITVESWIFIGPNVGDPDEPPMATGADVPNFLPIVDLGAAAQKDNIILAVDRTAGGTNHGLEFRIYQDAVAKSVNAPSVLPEGEWIHVAATLDNQGNAVLLCNGEPVLETEFKDGDTPWLPRITTREENFTFIGRSNPGSLQAGDGMSFWGKIDEVRIWLRPRSPKQLKGYMRRLLPEVHERLVGMWRFDEGSGIATFDSTKNGYHGLLGDGTTTENKPNWVIPSERLNAGLLFDQEGFVSIRSEDIEVNPAATLDFDVVENLTLEAWIKPEDDTPDANCKIIALGNQDDSASIEVTYGANNTDLRILLRNGGNEETLDFPNAFISEFWTHLGAVLEKDGDDKTNIRLTIHQENKLEPLTEITGALDVAFPDTSTFTDIQLGQLFLGTIDELRIWNHARTVGQISANLFCKVDPFDSKTPTFAFTTEGDSFELANEMMVERSKYGILNTADTKLLKLQKLRIPMGRKVSVVSIKTVAGFVTETIINEAGEAEEIQTPTETVATRAVRHFEFNTENIYDGEFVEILDETAGEDAIAQVIAGTIIEAEYVIEKIQVGYSETGGLLGYWPMNENTGQEIQDKTARQNKGVFELPATVVDPENPRFPRWVETSEIQYDGYRFDGYSEFVEIPQHDKLNPVSDFSITAWIEPNRFHGLQGIVTKVADMENSQFAMSMEGEMLRFDYEKDGNNFSLVGGKIKDGWNHVAVTVKTRSIDTQVLMSNADYILRKPKAFIGLSRPAEEVPQLLEKNTIVGDSHPLKDMKSLYLPVSKATMIIWQLKDNANFSTRPYRPRTVVMEYHKSSDDIFEAFEGNRRRYEVTRADLLEFYEITRITVKLITQRRTLRLPKIHLYVNGLLVHSGIAFEETTRTGFNINIGAWGGKFRKYFFHGTIDAVGLWGRALSQDQIQTLKDSPAQSLGGITPNGLWRPNPATIQSGVPNKPPNTYGLGQLGVYEELDEMYLYGPRASRAFTAASSVQITNRTADGDNKTINLSGNQLTIEYWFRGSHLGNVFSQDDGTAFIRSGASRPNPNALPGGTEQLPSHAFSNDSLDALELLKVDHRLDVTDGDWHHIAVVWHQNQEKGYRAYLDGQVIAQGDTANVPLPKMDTITEIGKDIVGQLAEVRVWKVARQANDIRKHKNRVLEGDEAGLMAYWPLNDTEGNQILDIAEKARPSDVSVIKKHDFEGVAVNTNSIEKNDLYLMSPFGGITLNALNFDGVDDFVAIADVPGIKLNANFTVETWIKLPCAGPIFSRMVIDQTELGEHRWAWKTLFVEEVSNTRRRLVFGYRPSSGRYLKMGSVDLPNDEDWHHVAVSVDINRLRMLFYIDGEEEGRANLKSSFRRDDPGKENRDIPISNINVGVGKITGNRSTPLDYFSGSIGELRFWNTIRDTTRIRNNFQRAIGNDEIGLEGLWRFTKGDGEIIDSLLPEESSDGQVFGAEWRFNTGFELFGAEDAQFGNQTLDLDPNCLHLNGGTERLDLGNPAHLRLIGDMSLEVWAYLDTISGTQTLISKGAGAEFDLTFEGNKLQYTHGGKYRQEYDFDFKAGQWYHIAFIREGGLKFVRAFVNGKSVTARIFDKPGSTFIERPSDQQQVYTADTLPIVSGNSLLVGNNRAGDQGLSGRVMDVRIWRDLLRPSRIELFKSRRLRGDELGLIAYLPLSTNGNDLDIGDTKRIDVNATVDASFIEADLGTTITADGLNDGDINQPVSVDVAVNDISVHQSSDWRYKKASYELTLRSESANVKRIQVSEDIANRFNGKLVKIESTDGPFVLNPRFGQRSNILEQGTSKTIVITVKLMPGFTFNGDNIVVTGLNSDDQRRSVRFRVSRLAVNGDIGSFAITLDRSRAYHHLEIEANFQSIFSGPVAGIENISGDFQFNPGFDGLGNNALLLNDPNYESALLAIPDFSRNTNNAVMHGGQIAPIMRGSNNLDVDEFSAVRLKVRVFTKMEVDGFRNAIIARGEKINGQAVVVTLEKGAPEAEITSGQSDNPGPGLMAVKSDLIEDAIIVDDNDDETEEVAKFEAVYSVLIRNTGQEGALSNLQIEENLAAIFEDESVIKLIDRWEVLTVEDALEPANLLPPIVIDNNLAGGTPKPSVVNPLFDGKDDMDLLGLALEKAREVRTPPINLAKVAHDRELLEAKKGRNSRLRDAKYATPQNNVPGQVIVEGKPPKPDVSTIEEEVETGTPQIPAADELEVKTIDDIGNPIEPILELKLENGEVTLGDIALPDAAKEIFGWVAEADTEADPDEVATLTISSPTKEFLKNDDDENIGFHITGIVGIVGTEFGLNLKLFKTEVEASSGGATETKWDFTFIFTIINGFDFGTIGLGAHIPLVSSIGLTANGLDSTASSRLGTLEGGHDSIGSVAAVDDYILNAISNLMPLGEFATAVSEGLDDNISLQLKSTKDYFNAIKAMASGDADAPQITGEDFDEAIAAEVTAIDAQSPYPSLHTHQQQPIRKAKVVLEGLGKREDAGSASTRVKRSNWVIILGKLLEEKDTRTAELIELKTKDLMPLGFAISSVGEENTKIKRGFSVNGGIETSSAGPLAVAPSDFSAGFFVNVNPGQGASSPDNPQTSYIAELGLRANLVGSDNPVFSLVNDIFGLEELMIFGYAIKQSGADAQDLIGLKAEASINLTGGSLSEPMFLVNAIFGVEEIFLSLEGSKEANGEAELTFEGRATVNVATAKNPLMKIAHTLIGLNSVELVVAADSSGDVSMIASSFLSLRDADTEIMTFLLDLFGLEDVTMLTVMEVSKVGSRTSLGVSTEILISLGDSTSPFFQFIHDFFAIEEISVFIEVDEEAFSIQIDLGINKVIAEVHRLVNVYIATILEYTPPSSTIRLGMAFELDTGDGIITLAGALGVKVIPGNVAVEGMLGMKGNWENPLGIQGIALQHVIVELGLSPNVPWINKIALAAKMRISRATMEIAVKVDLNDPKNNGFVGDIKNVNMLDVVSTLTGPQNTIPRGLQPVLAGMQLNRFFLSVIPYPPLTIGEEPTRVEYTDEGITAICDLNLWGFEAFTFLQINYTDGILAFASFSAMEFIPGVLKIEAAATLTVEDKPVLPARFESKGGPEMMVKLNTHDTPEIYLQGKVTLLEMMSLEMMIFINAEKLKFIGEANFLDLFVLKLEVEAATDFSSLFIRAEMKNDFFAKAREMAVKKIRELRDAALGKLNEAQAEVDGLWDAIEDRRKVVKAALEEAQRELRNARRKVTNASKEVDSLRDDIDDLDDWFDDLSWWKQGLRAIDYGVRKGAMEAAYWAAKGLLKIAEGVLYGLEKLIDIVPIDLDPFIIGLKAAHAIATAGLEIAKLAVKGFAAVAEGLVRLALGEFFDIRYAMFQGTYSVGPYGKFEVLMKANIVFLGAPMTVDFYVDLKAIENGISTLVTKLLE